MLRAPSLMVMKSDCASTAFAVSVFKENANVIIALGNAHKVRMQARDGHTLSAFLVPPLHM